MLSPPLLCSLNGHDLGVAFVGFDTEGLYPAASMNVGQAAHFNFGYSPFLYTPPHSDGSPFQPVTDAVADNVNADPDAVDITRVAACAAHPELREMKPPDLPLSDTIARSVGEVRREDERADSGGQCPVDEVPSTRIIERNDGEVRATRNNNRALYGGDESDPGGGAEEDCPHLELQRQGLVENLIGMGFPVDWAIRAAEESGV